MQSESILIRISKFLSPFLLFFCFSGNVCLANSLPIISSNGIDVPLHNSDKDKELKFKKSALQFAKQGDAEQACYFLEEYIKSSLDIAFMNSSGFKVIEKEEVYISLKNKYLKKIDFWALFCLYVGFIGIFIFTVLTLKRGGDKIAKILIGSFLLLHSIFIIRVSIFLTNYEYYLPHTLYVSATFSFLYGPIIFFYFKRILQKYSFKWMDIIHFLPTILFIIAMFPIYQLTREEKLSLIINNERPFMEIISLLKVISLSIYSFLLIRLFLKSKRVQNGFSKKERVWQRNIIVFVSLYIISYGVYISLINDSAIRGLFFHLQVILMSLLVLYISYNSFISLNIPTVSVVNNDTILEEQTEEVIIKTELLSKSDDLIRDTKIEVGSPQIALSNQSNKTKSKYKKSNLTVDVSDNLKKDLLRLLEVDKIYRQNDLTLPKLAEALDTTRNITSQIINESFGLNFFELLNKYRIQEAKHILNSREYINIIDVAYEVGYNNKVTFNKSFKKFNNVTPSEYLQSKSA